MYSCQNTIDSGCSSHMTNKKELLHDRVKTKPAIFKVAKAGHCITSQLKGKQENDNIVFENVSYVQNLEPFIDKCNY